MTLSDQWQPRTNPWVIAVVVAMAAFMEVLDTSIANVSLPHMAGSLGASYDQSTWATPGARRTSSEPRRESSSRWPSR